MYLFHHHANSSPSLHHHLLHLRPQLLCVLPRPQRVQDVGVRPRQRLGRRLHSGELVDLLIDAARLGTDARVELAEDGVSGGDLCPGEVQLIGPLPQLEQLHPVLVGNGVEGLGGATGGLDLGECGLPGLVEDLSRDGGEQGPGVAPSVAVPGVAPDQDPGLAGGDQFLVLGSGRIRSYDS